jgi:hypothetical protein
MALDASTAFRMDGRGDKTAVAWTRGGWHTDAHPDGEKMFEMQRLKRAMGGRHTDAHPDDGSNVESLEVPQRAQTCRHD